LLKNYIETFLVICSAVGLYYIRVNGEKKEGMKETRDGLPMSGMQFETGYLEGFIVRSECNVRDAT